MAEDNKTFNALVFGYLKSVSPKLAEGFKKEVRSKQLNMNEDRGKVLDTPESKTWLNQGNLEYSIWDLISIMYFINAQF